MKQQIKLLFIIFSNIIVINTLFAQENSYLDTLKFGNKQIILEVPITSKKTLNSYEEGTFVTYNIYTDTCIITVHSGKMVSFPLVNKKDCIIIDEFSLKEERIRLKKVKGKCLNAENEFWKKNGFYREDNYFDYGISILYENVDESKISKYDSILDNINIEIGGNNISN